ncbi:MAG: glycoside-pentoside-hexuronide (GPH):cation symporter [Anaerolineae bacterium]|nr:glycoside-pentoside-hexuronide (GPH):cation symporter [Anaerolineae bacterium]
MFTEHNTEDRQAHPEKLSFLEKLTYGLGDVAHSVGPGTILPFWYLFFLTDVAHLRPDLAGLAILIGGIWDAVNDPLIGLWSDRTRTRWGRRRPFLLFGALPYGITFALMWLVPPIESQILKCFYYAGIYILFDTAVTAVSCPYYALTPELTLDHDERTSLTSYRMFISIVAGLATAVGFALVLDAAPNEQAAFRTMGIGASGLFVATILVTFFGTRERVGFQAERPSSPLESLRFVLRNREWWYTVGMRILSWIPVDVASAVFAYYLIYWIRMRPMEASLVQAALLASAAVSLPVVLWMTRRWEKKTSFIIAIASWAVVMLGLLLVPQGARNLVYPIAVLVGPGVAAAHALPTAMSADTLDVDELNSGQRQEGVYAGFEVFIRKLSTKLVLATIGPVLAWSGYVERATTQTPETLMVIRLLIAVVPAVILFGAVAVAWRYPLTRERHRAIQKELADRRAVTADPRFEAR